MFANLVSFLVLALSPAQTVNGVAPIDVGSAKLAQAYAAQLTATPSFDPASDIAVGAYFLWMPRSIQTLTMTKWVAAHLSVCGTLVGLFDETYSNAVRVAAKRVIDGSKDFDTFTKGELDALNKAFANEDSALYPFSESMLKDKGKNWQYYAGAGLGTLSGYLIVWHISPKDQSLLKLIGDQVKSIVDHGAKPDGSARADLAAAMKEFAKFVGKTLDEKTVRAVGAQTTASIKLLVPAKHRW